MNGIVEFNVHVTLLIEKYFLFESLLGAALNKGQFLTIENQRLYIDETPLGGLEVWQCDNIRTLYLRDKKAIQSQLDMAHKENLQLQYNRAMMSFLLFQEQPESILLLGLGGGSLIHFLTHWFPELKITAIENNEEVVKIGKKYFALSSLSATAQVNLVIADAFVYLKRKKQKNVNVMLVDLHDGDSLPKFMYTPAFMERCFHHLSPGGVLVINLLVKNDKEFTDILVELRHFFSDVSLCMAFENQKNILLFAFKAPSPLDLTQLKVKANRCQNKYNIEFEEFIRHITPVEAR